MVFRCTGTLNGAGVLPRPSARVGDDVAVDGLTSQERSSSQTRSRARVPVDGGAWLGTRFHARPFPEWQGMLVDMSHRQYCERTAQCGLARACLSDGLCGPCADDRDCLESERCVLDHCLLSSRIGCTVAADCGGRGALCVLSGYSAFGRANESMRSFCSGGQR